MTPGEVVVTGAERQAPHGKEIAFDVRQFSINFKKSMQYGCTPEIPSRHFALRRNLERYIFGLFFTGWKASLTWTTKCYTDVRGSRRLTESSCCAGGALLSLMV